jgi:hypothetical protein
MTFRNARDMNHKINKYRDHRQMLKDKMYNHQVYLTYFLITDEILLNPRHGSVIR